MGKPVKFPNILRLILIKCHHKAIRLVMHEIIILNEEKMKYSYRTFTNEIVKLCTS